MSNTITNSDGEFNKTGKINLEELNIDLSVILGEQLASEYFKYISEEQLEEKLKEDIAKKIEEIVETDEYKKRADEIAQEIVEYTTEGYKKDMMARVKARLVEDPLSSNLFGGVDLRGIVREEIYNAVRTQ